jgi:sarcosine oxidase subunit alpha
MSDSPAQPFRLAAGGRIDRSRPLSFTFDGRAYQGFAGDTVASALLASGVHLVGRSFKYHRPRGIVTAGIEEPNALLQVGDDPATEPNVKATVCELVEGLKAQSQNRWPALGFDVGALNSLVSKFLPSGFYYKTFMWPPSTRGWLFWEKFIRKAAGLGKAPTGRDADRYDKSFAHCDVAVIGGGAAGLAAALAAGRAGKRVVLAELDHELGGWLLTQREAVIDGQPALDWVAKAAAELAGLPNVQVMTRAICFAYFDHNFLGLWQNLADHLAPAERPKDGPRHRLVKLRAKQVILATGAIERPLVFRDNDRPGVMLAGAAQAFVNRWAVKPGSKAVVVTNNDSAYGAALDLKAAGVEIAAVVDLRQNPDGALTDRAEAAGIRVLADHGVIAVQGKARVTGVQIAPLAANGQGIGQPVETVACDLLLNAGGFTPTVHLFSQAKGKLAWDEARQWFKPGQAGQPNQLSVGACNGTWGLGAALQEGFAAGGGNGSASAADEDFLPLRPLWLIPADKPLGHKGKHFVDQQNDVTAADLKLALREGYVSIEHLKRYTTNGMATDQGKTSNMNALAIVAETLARPLPEIGTTTFRAPYAPVSFGAFMGRDADDLLDPLRKTPMDPWQEANGAKFENVGQWRRAWYYPKAGEDIHAAVNREVKAVRDSVGILDASTLGKIDIKGPDAAEFINRIYTNAFLKLEVGRCRYGLMLKEDGMVMDDGVTARLAPDHFLMHTTTGNAAPVLNHLEEYLQTEWPQMKVFLTSVTEQWATVQVAGPRARTLIGEIAPGLDLSTEAFPFMAVRHGEVLGQPARIFRISFTGEGSWEINIAPSYGLALWEALMTAGAKYGITPYGTEAMHVLRAEKGFIIVGQETDGSVNPLDLGMEGMVSKTKDFVGKRSLYRADMAKPDRKQLVGLLTDDPKAVLPEGAQLVADPKQPKPMTQLGHVTSSYWSPNLGHAIAMALVKGGRARMGQTLYAPLAGGRVIACKVTETVFYDKEGVRLRG